MLEESGQTDEFPQSQDVHSTDLGRIVRAPSRVQSQTRHTHGLLQEQNPSKKPKPSGGKADRPLNFPPEFYDNLSEVQLTRLALEEFNRRNKKLYRRPQATAYQTQIKDLSLAIREGGLNLARFARAGGPDFSDLRGVCLYYLLPS